MKPIDIATAVKEQFPGDDHYIVVVYTQDSKEGRGPTVMDSEGKEVEGVSGFDLIGPVGDTDVLEVKNFLDENHDCVCSVHCVTAKDPKLSVNPTLEHWKREFLQKKEKMDEQSDA